jgi:hypothetical protein
MEIGRMESLFFQYERENLASGRKLEEENAEVVPLTPLEEVWAWEDFAVRQYVRGLQDSFVQQIDNPEPRAYAQ